MSYTQATTVSYAFNSRHSPPPLPPSPPRCMYARNVGRRMQTRLVLDLCLLLARQRRLHDRQHRLFRSFDSTSTLHLKVFP